ncbi:MAG: alpha/beta fold hydrolase [Vicinamibacterales bacterium]
MPTGPLLVLAHGAGAGQGHPFMTAVATGLAERGLAVATFDFPYMAEGRRVPDRLPVLEAAFRDAVERARATEGLGVLPLIIGGKSMGGRVATHLAVEGLGGLRGVISLGYPLHPPGRPERPRTAHLPGIRIPWLIVQGERDAFGTPDELQPVLAGVPGPVTLDIIAGGDHSFAVPRRMGRTEADVRTALLDRVASWSREVCGGAGEPARTGHGGPADQSA